MQLCPYHIIIMDWRMERQVSFLKCVLREGQANRCNELLRLANADQIDAVSELSYEHYQRGCTTQSKHGQGVMPTRSGIATNGQSSQFIEKETQMDDGINRWKFVERVGMLL